MRPLGTHWLARATGCDPQALGDPDSIRATLRHLPDTLGLTRVGEPVVHMRAEGGVAGVVLLSESHASLHASPSDGTLFADVFSCASFDPTLAEQVLREAFSPRALSCEVIERGPVTPASGLQTRPDGRQVVVDDTRADRRALDLEVSQVVFEGQSEHQHVLVVDTPALGRVLYLDGVLQSAEHDEAVYHRALVHPAMAAHPNPTRVLIAGGGEGAAAREVLRHAEVQLARMVDFDRVVVDVCTAHMPALGAWQDPRLEVLHRDFFKVLAAAPGAWDVILVDLAEESLAVALAPTGLRHLSRGLAPHGVVALSLGAWNEDTDALLETVRQIFPDAQQYTAWLESQGGRWAYAVSRAPLGPLAHTPDSWEGLTWRG